MSGKAHRGVVEGKESVECIQGSEFPREESGAQGLDDEVAEGAWGPRGWPGSFVPAVREELLLIKAVGNEGVHRHVQHGGGLRIERDLGNGG